VIIGVTGSQKVTQRVADRSRAHGGRNRFPKSLVGLAIEVDAVRLARGDMQARVEECAGSRAEGHAARLAQARA
jgi:hypothetical protein